MKVFHSLLFLLFCLPLCSQEEGWVCGDKSQVVFLQPPADFSPCFEVAGCFCEYADEVLFLLRNGTKPQGSSWCIPGGKLEKGETPRQAVIREIKEEVGIDLSLENLFYQHSVYVRLSTADFILHLFRYPFSTSRPSVQLALDEHIAYRWVDVQEACGLSLIPGGKECFCLVFQEQLKEPS